MTERLTVLDLLAALGEIDRTDRTARRRLAELRAAGLQAYRHTFEGARRWCWVVDRDEWERFIGEDTMAITPSQRVDAAA